METTAPRYRYVLVPIANETEQREQYVAQRVLLATNQKRPGPKWRHYSRICKILYDAFDMNNMGPQFFDPERLQDDIKNTGCCGISD